MFNFLENSTEKLAQQLLGTILVYTNEDGKRLSGYIVETEAYLGAIDKACHSYELKRTPRLHSMYQNGGILYVYTMHTHHLLNIVTQIEGDPQAILIRAMEPIDGIKLMQTQRKTIGYNLTNGPGKLTIALGITTKIDGQPLGMQVALETTNRREPQHITASPRIGIPNKGSWTQAPLRYYVTGNPYVSGIKKSDIDSPSHGWK